jgi:nucleoside-diphosphate-sugar epimerase
MKVLVLGSSGCVGRSMVSCFQQKGHTVIPWDIKMGEQYDLRKQGVLDSILPQIDFVLFLAFDVGGSKYNVHSTQYIENNLLLLNNTFRSIEKFQKPFIHTTSQMSNMNNNPYAVLKRLAEFYTEILGGVNVKLWNVYGSEDISEKSHVINDFIDQAVNKGSIKMRTKGREERLFLYCDDFADAVYTIFMNYEKFRNTKPIDISNRDWATIHDVANIIKDLSKELLQKEISVEEGPLVDTFQSLRNEPGESYLNELWKPTVSLKEGIRHIFMTYLSQ